MKEKSVNHYVESVLYAMEQTVVYFKIKGAQFFASLNSEITIDQFAALDAIYCNNNICQRDLSKIILKDRSNTGRILNILEEKGLIKRIVETKNKRLVKKIYITEKGKAIVEDSIPKLKDAFAQIFEEHSEEEFATLRKILERLTNILSQSTSIQI